MRTDIDFKNYTDSDYEALSSFLIALNEKDDSHINWNWILIMRANIDFKNYTDSD